MQSMGPALGPLVQKKTHPKDIPQQVEQMATKMIKELVHLSDEKLESWGCSAWRRDGSGAISSMGENEQEEGRLFCGTQLLDKCQPEQIISHEILYEH